MTNPSRESLRINTSYANDHFSFPRSQIDDIDRSARIMFGRLSSGVWDMLRVVPVWYSVARGKSSHRPSLC